MAQQKLKSSRNFMDSFCVSSFSPLVWIPTLGCRFWSGFHAFLSHEFQGVRLRVVTTHWTSKPDEAGSLHSYPVDIVPTAHLWKKEKYSQTRIIWPKPCEISATNMTEWRIIRDLNYASKWLDYMGMCVCVCVCVCASRHGTIGTCASGCVAPWVFV